MTHMCSDVQYTFSKRNLLMESNEFQKHLASKEQTNCYSGASSHHQNGHVEGAIQTIMGMAQTIMIHSAIHWSQIVDATLWLMCVNHAMWIYNHVPNMKTCISPNDLWSKTKFPLNQLHDTHLFGCPVYILEKKLADGKSMPRWEACSQRVMYLGQAPDCTGSKPLVLNLQTRNITS